MNINDTPSAWYPSYNVLDRIERWDSHTKEIVRRRVGLRAMQHLAKITYQRDFTELTEQEQLTLVSKLQKGQNALIPSFQDIPQKKLFKKLVGLIVEAYYSHPTVWSEIGYGGPVYPDVYVRVELGLTDPWEAKRVGE